MSIHTSGLWILKAVLAWWYWLCSFWRGFSLSGSLTIKSYWHQSDKYIIYTNKFRLHIILLWCIGKGISQYNEVQIQLIWYFAVLIHSDQAFVNSKHLHPRTCLITIPNLIHCTDRSQYCYCSKWLSIKFGLDISWAQRDENAKLQHKVNLKCIVCLNFQINLNT